jgi:drug/metabolite transporter (DMT)-like permease
MQMTPARQGHLAMLCFSMLVAGSFSLGSLAANEMAPGALNAVRFALAAVVIGLAVVARGGIERSAFQAPWRYLVLGGIFGTYFVLMFEGLKTAPPVGASAVFTFIPVMAAGFGWVLLRQVLTKRMALALSIGALGALWVIFRADISALLAFEIGRGELIFFVGCVFHAFYTPLVRKLNRGEPALVFTFGVLLGGCVLITVTSWTDLMSTDWAKLPAIVWITIVYISIFASAVTFVLMQFATMRLPSAKVMAYTYLTPSWVILWQIALGFAVPTGWILGGVGLTIVALLLLLRDEA